MDPEDIEAQYWEDCDDECSGGGIERWTCADGKSVLVQDMTPSHLDNAINLFRCKLELADEKMREAAVAIAKDTTDAEARAKMVSALAAASFAETKAEILLAEKARRGKQSTKLKDIRAALAGESIWGD